MAKIMLVEDDNNLREIYEARLQAEGYTIVSAKDGEEALVLAKNENPDLIITDVMMPKVSGFEMLDILRNTDGLRDTKIIMLTALGQSEDQTRADRLGANRYLVKSQVTLEDIVKVAHELLKPASESTPVVPTSEAIIATPAVEVNVPPIAVPAVDTTQNIDFTTTQPITTPPTDYADEAVTPTGIAPTTAEPIITQTTAQEEVGMESKIESFIDNNDVVADHEPIDDASPTSNDLDNSKVMTDAIDTLMAKTRTEPLPEPNKPNEAQASVSDSSRVYQSTPTLITPSVPIIDGNVPIVHKKIISPLDVTLVPPRTDINVLLAQEEAKSATMNSAPPEPQSPDTTPESVKAFDPNNIAL